MTFVTQRVRQSAHLLLTFLLVVAASSLPARAQLTSDQSNSLQELAKQAINVVTRHVSVNGEILEPKSNQPLSTKGKWQVHGRAPEACPHTTESCVAVVYHVAEADISCEWVVLLTGDGSDGKILTQNADASRYFLVRLRPVDAKPLVESRQTPTYPPIALAAHVDGEVSFRVIVDDQGKLVKQWLVSGPPMLRAAATDALKQWTFKPLMLGSQAAPFETQVTFEFVTSEPTAAGSVILKP